MLIDVSSFPKFGTMTSGNGLAGIFDSLGAATAGYAPTTRGTAGIDCRTNPQSVDKVVLTCASNGWDASGASGGAVILRLFGKSGSAPTDHDDGIQLGSSGPIKDINEVLTHAIYSSNYWTKWDWLWVTVETQVWAVLTDLKFFAPVVPVIGSSPRVLRRRSDSSQSLSKNGTYVHGLRFLFELTQPAAVVPLIKVEVEHMKWSTGVPYWLSCGCYLYHRTSLTLEMMPFQSYQELDVSGRNLDPDIHYERHEPRDAVQLAAGFHEILPNLNSNTYQANTDWYTSVLVEYGRGLNKGVIFIDPGAEVIQL